MLTPNQNGLTKRDGPPNPPLCYSSHPHIALPMNNPDWFSTMPSKRRVRVHPPVPVAMEDGNPGTPQTGSTGGLFSFFSMGSGAKKSSAAAPEGTSSALVDAPRPVGDSPPKQRVAESSSSTAPRNVYQHQGPIVQFGPLAVPLWKRRSAPHANHMEVRPTKNVSQMLLHAEGYPSSPLAVPHPLFPGSLTGSSSVRPPAPVGPKLWMPWASPTQASATPAQSSSSFAMASGDSFKPTSQGTSSSLVGPLASSDDSYNRNNTATQSSTRISSSSCNLPLSEESSTSTRTKVLSASSTLSQVVSCSLVSSSNPSKPLSSTSHSNKISNSIDSPHLSNPGTAPRSALFPGDFLHPSTNYPSNISAMVYQTQPENPCSGALSTSKIACTPLTNSFAEETVPPHKALVSSHSYSTGGGLGLEQDIWGTNEQFRGSTPMFFSSPDSISTAGTGNEGNFSPAGISKLSVGDSLPISGVHFYDPLNAGSLLSESPQVVPLPAPSTAVVPKAVVHEATLGAYSPPPSPFSTSYLDTGSTLASVGHSFGTPLSEDNGMKAIKGLTSTRTVEEEDGLDTLRKLLQSVGMSSTMEENSNTNSGGMMMSGDLLASLSSFGGSGPSLSFSSPHPFSTSSRGTPQQFNGLFPNL